MRLIDADALESEVKRAHLIFEDGTENMGYTAVYLGSAVRNAPTVEPKKGEWIKVLVPIGESVFGIDEGTAEAVWCSLCKKDYWTVDAPMNFCPNCGADMRGDNPNE